MRDLETLIAQWRKAAIADASISSEVLDELESHLRDQVESLILSGMAAPEAFHEAAARLGAPSEISAEFRKLPEPLWLPVKVIVGFAAMAALLLLSLFARADTLGFLLVSHVYLVILGYSLVFCTGALGICGLGQRSFSDIRPGQLRSIQRAIVVFSAIALVLTTAAVVLGALWAKAEWGRYWGWDLKEVGGLCVIVWLTGSLVLHRFARRLPRGILQLSVLGNVVVSLAWFGPPLVTSLHTYGTATRSLFLLAAASAISLAFFLTGFAPSGWLRSARNDARTYKAPE